MTRILQLAAPEFRARAADAASVYGAAMQRSAEVVVQRRDIIAVHAGNRGFKATVALEDDDDRMVGFGYGYLGSPGQWWHDIVAKALGREGSKRWLRDSFELAELHVLPQHQGNGIGRALLNDLLDRADTAHVVLSTPDTESAARRLYRSTGFADLVTGFYFPGSSEAYAIMGSDL
jgi:ribosomal protein S18 acetylase RimI-like enzyme